MIPKLRDFGIWTSYLIFRWPFLTKLISTVRGPDLETSLRWSASVCQYWWRRLSKVCFSVLVCSWVCLEWCKSVEMQKCRAKKDSKRWLSVSHGSGDTARPPRSCWCPLSACSQWVGPCSVTTTSAIVQDTHSWWQSEVSSCAFPWPGENGFSFPCSSGTSEAFSPAHAQRPAFRSAWVKEPRRESPGKGCAPKPSIYQTEVYNTEMLQSVLVIH